MSINVDTHGFWRFFYHDIQLKPESPILHRYPTHEVDEPYRWAKSFIIKLHKDGRGIVLGWWRKTNRNEEQALIDAMAGRQMTDTEFQSAEKAHIRRTMIKKQYPSDHQELIIDALDL